MCRYILISQGLIFQGFIATSLVCFEPVMSDAAVGDEGDGEVDGILHLVHDDSADGLHLRGRDVEVQFVVHLHDHLRSDGLSVNHLARHLL